jgi:hypothetical protein
VEDPSGSLNVEESKIRFIDDNNNSHKRQRSSSIPKNIPSLNLSSVKCIFLAAIFLVSYTGVALTQEWPEIKGFKEEFHFQDPSKADFDIPTKGVKGENLYKLKCHDGTVKYVSDPAWLESAMR